MNETSIQQYLIDFVNENETYVVEDWYKRVLHDMHDINKDKIKENGTLMYRLVKQSVIDSISEKDLEFLAHKVARERVEANVNIGNFVHNVNLGRYAIVSRFFTADIPVSEIQKVIDKVNRNIDLFTYYAVSNYTLLKDQEIQEKNFLLNQAHIDKLTILGKMSSSFVHEFRNPLTSVMGFIKLLKMDDPDLKYIDIIEHELDELKFRITQFLHTSKSDAIMEQRKELFCVQTLLQEIIEFLYPSIVDNDVLIITEFAKKTEFFANKGELKQVFLNILMNSIDALTKKEKPREICVCTHKENEHVLIKITNNGPRIPEKSIEIIFEPFYTTKDLGTGIGLFVCKKIIEKHHGTISCTSNDEQTTFIIELPINVTN